MREDQLSRSEDSRDTAAVVATVIAVVIAAIYWISRIGFANPVTPVLDALGVSLFLIAAPLAGARLAHNAESWWMSQSAIGLACLTLVTAAGIAARATGTSVVIVFVIAGFVLALLTLVRWISRGPALRSIGFLLGAIIFAVWCAGVIWGSRYKMPLFWETLALKANIHHDTFYYASMANMLDTYGVASTGLDGLPLIRYHFGSTWLYAQWSHLLGSDVLTFYSLGYPIIVLPFFFSTMLLMASELGAALRKSWWPWIVLLGATAGFLPWGALYDVGVWNANAFISESYLIGMAVFFLVSGAAIAFWRTDKIAAKRISSFVFFLLFAPTVIVVLGLLKISLMILIFAVGMYLALRLGLFRRPIVLASAVVCLVAFLFTFVLVNLPAQNRGIVPLDFMRHNNEQGWQQFFPLIHLLWTWIYLAARAWEEGVRDMSTLGSAVKSGRLIDAEALAVVTIVGFLPGEIVSIYGGSSIYFSDVQRWLAVSLIMARVGVWVTHRKPGQRYAGVRLSSVLLVCVLAPFVLSLFMNLVQIPGRVVRANLATRRELAQGSRYYPIVHTLRQIAKIPRAERRNALLFIPQWNRDYWSMFTADGRCTFTPLIAPAIASVAMLDGMPSFGCKVTDQYNMTSYKPRTTPQEPSDVTTEALCAKTRARGFREVMVLTEMDQGVPDLRRIDCYLHSP